MYDVIVVGSGMGSLSAAALLAKNGLKPLILEQNWLPGGCTTSYWRKGFVFEAGATTLVGLDDHQPLKYLLDATGIQLQTRRLSLPMQIHMKDGQILNRHENIDQWIRESEGYFGTPQQDFWKKCFKLSKFVWKASTKYLHFPPKKPKDFFSLAKAADVTDLGKIPYAFKNTAHTLQRYGLGNNHDFLDLIDEQLMITAQNRSYEVNFLFGAAALCYTNYSNHYVDGGLINLVKPIVDYIELNGGKIIYRTAVKSINRSKEGYKIHTKDDSYSAPLIVSGIPLNNLYQFELNDIDKKETNVLAPKHLYSAFQMGIGFKSDKIFDSLHHQIHLTKSLSGLNSKSIFISLNHPEDTSRSDIPGCRVASVSTHIENPHQNIIDSSLLEKEVIKILEDRGFLKSSDIVYAHSSGPKSWAKWTGRAHGFVGGYPQFMGIKPWQMVEARLDDGLYHCGDTAYPGQGIPGATLSGIIAATKLLSDH